jgi:hypothetical protein
VLVIAGPLRENDTTHAELRAMPEENTSTGSEKQDATRKRVETPRERFVWMATLLADDDVNDRDARVLCRFGLHFNFKTKRCDPGAATLAEETGKSKRTVQRVFEGAVKLGYLRRAQRGGGSRNTQYELFIPANKSVPTKVAHFQDDNVRHFQDACAPDSAPMCATTSAQVIEFPQVSLDNRGTGKRTGIEGHAKRRGPLKNGACDTSRERRGRDKRGPPLPVKKDANVSAWDAMLTRSRKAAEAEMEKFLAYCHDESGEGRLKANKASVSGTGCVG